MSKAWDDMKKTKEEEYFRNVERDKLAAIAAKKATPELRMRCPKCGGALADVDFQGVRIDRCTACSGMWLDAGEIEKIASRGSEELFSKLLKSIR